MLSRTLILEHRTNIDYTTPVMVSTYDDSETIFKSTMEYEDIISYDYHASFNGIIY